MIKCLLLVVETGTNGVNYKIIHIIFGFKITLLLIPVRDQIIYVRFSF